MNTVLEKPAYIIQDAVPKTEATPVGNNLYLVEVSNLVIGSIEEIIEDMADSEIAAARMNEETEPMETVFSELGIR